MIQGDRLVGACLYGDTADGAWYFRLIREGKEIGALRDQLMFGEHAVGDTGHAGESRAAGHGGQRRSLRLQRRLQGHHRQGHPRAGPVHGGRDQKHTKAASSCGSCTGLVEQILINCVGGAADVKPSSEKPVCGCTSHTHGELRRAIREHHLTRVADVMAFMEWRTPDGCATCRPAINYYLLSTWPGEARDDSQSRLANERMHANIQKDGTYSVVPRMWGGVTNASELRRIADVADKYAIPMVKVTGGQRIDLLGVRKEDLPKVWQDLDMPSGHAYGKSLRTVKTCVGSEFCRFGTQDSTGMGIALEKDLVGMWSPHKVKLAVSGCPRNCAESGIKDVGIIAVESGWELYVGGNGGIKTEVAQFFVKVQTQDEVLEYAGAFLQLYREEAFYLERTVHYLARVGLEHARRQVVEDPENRKLLYARLRFALSFESDPGARERRARPPRASSRSFPHERRHDNRHHHAKLVRDLPGRGHSTGAPHRAPSRPRGHRRVPQPWRRGVRPDRPLPHKGGPLSAGLVHGRSVTCLAQLGGRPGQRPGAGARRGLRPGGRCPGRGRRGQPGPGLAMDAAAIPVSIHPARDEGAEVASVCCYCGTGCGVRVRVSQGAVLAVRGDDSHPANHGRLCSKGLALADTVRADHARVLAASWRAGRDEPRKPIGLDQALDIAADRLADAIVRHGPDSVGFYLSGQLLTEDYAVFNKLARALVGTNNIDTNSRLCMSSAVSGYKRTLGADAPPACYEDLELADTVLIAGSNMAYAHPVLFRRLGPPARAGPA